MQRRHRRAHRRIWMVLAGFMPLILLFALALRHAGPHDAPPQLLAPPIAAPK